MTRAPRLARVRSAVTSTPSPCYRIARAARVSAFVAGRVLAWMRRDGLAVRDGRGWWALTG